MQYNPNKYLDFEELTKQLQNWEQAFPDLFRLESIGKTLEGRDIWLATITDYKSGEPDTKPAYWVDGNTHAGEVTGCQASIHTIHRLLTGFSEKKDIRSLLQKITFYVVPRISADGAEHFLKTGEYVRSTPLTFTDDDIPENFEQSDVNGDGHVLGMRIRDPKGHYKISKIDPRVMIPRSADDFVGSDEEFYTLIPEGKFKNYDGFTKRFAPKYRFDLNRQYPANFRTEGEQKGAGPYPMYLPEARAIVKAITDRPNIFGLQSFHTFSAIILRPYAGKDDLEMPIPDLECYKAFGKRGEEITDYPCVSVNHGFRYHPKIDVGGGFFDWAYEHRGIFAFTNEIWHLAIKAGLDISKDRVSFFQRIEEENLVKTLKWCDENLDAGTYFTDWMEFDHPQLGKVEIGGWHTKFTWTNPPEKFLAAEIEKNYEFVLSCAKAAPIPTIKSVAVNPVEPGSETKMISVICENDGYLATYGSEQAKKAGAVRPVRVTAEVTDGLKLISGKKFQEVNHLTGHSAGIPWRNSVFNGVFSLQNTEAGSEFKIDWVVQGTGVLDLDIDFHRAGILRKRIEV